MTGCACCGPKMDNHTTRTTTQQHTPWFLDPTHLRRLHRTHERQARASRDHVADESEEVHLLDGPARPRLLATTTHSASRALSPAGAEA